MVEENHEHPRIQSIVQSEDPVSGPRFGNSDEVLPREDLKEASRYNNNTKGASPQQQLTDGQLPNAPGHMNLPYTTLRDQTTGVFDMATLASSLPSQFRGSSQMPYQSAPRYQGGMSGMAEYNHPQIHGHPGMGAGSYAMPSSQYPQSFHEPSTAQLYAQMQGPQRPYSGGPSPIQSTFGGGSFPHNLPQQFMFYPGQPNPMNAASSYNQNLDSYHQEMSSRVYHSGFPTGSSQSNQFLRPDFPGGPSRGSSNSSAGSIPSTPRGPPRKPKQSGYALWVGNLPSGTAVGDLKDHFSREATKDIESVFLISKSNCAFVNYRSETACAAAMHRFHDSRFQGVRLVCRLRRGPNPNISAGTPSVPGAPSGPSAFTSETLTLPSAPEAITQNRQSSSRALEEASTEAIRRGQRLERVHEKFFVMKSLTVEDMELSARNRIWATQAHNEDALNKAYASADNVYLIFSANKSGEYFGYARMTSPINDEVSAGLDWAPKGESVVDDPDIPRSIPTPATEHAPRGRIIDDSARGTIFWEADAEGQGTPELARDDMPVANIKTTENLEDVDESLTASGPQSFGKPFRIEWKSTDRLPFYRTRGLRNPWNANREVKIARDGTELETSVGRRLVQMFHSPLDPRIAMPSYPVQR